MNEPKFPYRLVPYGTVGWQLEKYTVTGVKNPVTNKRNKNAGQGQWKAIRWPGTLRSASDALISLIMRDALDNEGVNIETFETCVERAVDQVSAVLAEWRQETENVGPKN